MSKGGREGVKGKQVRMSEAREERVTKGRNRRG